MLGFLKLLNPKQWFTIGGVVLGGILLWRSMGVLDSFLDSHRAMADNLQASLRKQASMAVQLQTMKQASRRNAEYLLWQQNALRRADEELRKLSENFNRYREIAAEEQAIFAEHNLARLARAKPGLIQIRANRATRRRFAEFERIFNGERGAP